MTTFYQTSLSDKDHMTTCFMGDVDRAFQRAFTEARDHHKLTQNKIAKALEIGRAVVNRRLLGRENMTERALAELAWAMGYSIEIRLVPFDLKYRPANIAFTEE